MKVSTKVQYGMLALADIALYSENGSAVSGPEIAERQDISQKYLEQMPQPAGKQVEMISIGSGRDVQSGFI